MKISITVGLLITMGITAFASILLLAGTIILYEFIDNKKEINDIKAQSTIDQRKMLMGEVDRVFNFIDYTISTNKNLPISTLQKKILNRIEKIRFGNGGYIFVNTYSGRALVFDGKIVSQDRSIINFTDLNGKNLYYLELDAAQKKDGGFIEYKFKKMNTDSIFPKISYIKGFSKWEWIIGAGDYQQDISNKIESLKSKLSTRLKIKTIRISIITLFIALLIIIFTLIISNKVQLEFSYLSDFFKDNKNSRVTLDISKLRLIELVKVGIQANAMIEQRMKLMQEIIDTEEKYRSFVDNSMVGIFITHEKTIEYCNKKFADFFSLSSPDHIIGKSIFELIYHEDAKYVDDHLNERNKTDLLLDEYKFRGKTKNNKIIYLKVIGSSIIYNNKPAFQGNLIDITQSEVQKREIQRYKDNLEEIINERTKELNKKNKSLLEINSDLTKYNEILVERELEIKKLQDKIETLVNRLDDNNDL